MKRFGEVVREARRSRGLTLEAVARVIRSHKGYVSGIEGMKVNPPRPAITRRLARALDLDPERLLALRLLDPVLARRKDAPGMRPVAELARAAVLEIDQGLENLAAADLASGSAEIPTAGSRGPAEAVATA